MAIKGHTHARQLLLVLLSILILVTTGCKQQPSRPPISSDEMTKLVTEFKSILDEQAKAYNNHDIEGIRDIHTQDVTFIDVGQNYYGVGEIINTAAWVFDNYPQFTAKFVDIFVGKQDVLSQWEYWNFFISDQNPVVNYTWQKSKEGKISYERTLYEPELYRETGYFGTIDTVLLDEYANAWSSGDAQAVANLYNPEAVRQDTLFGVDLHGSEAVKNYAADFFTWYPNVKLESLSTFGAPGKITTLGGIYAIHTTDGNGKPCDVKTAIVIETKENKVNNEWVFYNPDSLIACGWAQ
jgi:ketosteroid isomerase-like protein